MARRHYRGLTWLGRVRCAGGAPGASYIVLDRCCHTNLTLDNDTITLTDMKNGKKIPIEKHAYDKDREFYIAHLSQQLTPGKNNEKISQSKYTQFCIKGLLMVRDI